MHRPAHMEPWEVEVPIWHWLRAAEYGEPLEVTITRPVVCGELAPPYATSVLAHVTCAPCWLAVERHCAEVGVEPPAREPPAEMRPLPRSRRRRRAP